VVRLPTTDELVAALESVNDPHVPASLRRMGMLREVEIDRTGAVRVSVCIPCMACPGAGMIEDDIQRALMKVAGVREVAVELGWHLPWSPDMVEPDVRRLMRANGIQI
jgi:metal-sulfur cluster biosynthetic enzyme